jgi:hypothetical protein
VLSEQGGHIVGRGKPSVVGRPESTINPNQFLGRRVIDAALQGSVDL